MRSPSSGAGGRSLSYPDHVSEDADAYARGVTAGDVEARLVAHERRLAAINGNLAEIAHEMHGVLLALQRLADQAEGRDATVLTTASALDKADTQRRAADAQRREAAERSWSPVAKAATAIGMLVGILGIVAFFAR